MQLFLFFVKSGGRGCHKLSVMLTDSEGCTVCLLKSAFINGRHVLYLVSIQENPMNALNINIQNTSIKLLPMRKKNAPVSDFTYY